ncbi:unnamed protein product [Clonostachys chloroleuca]|uniref:Uncharacterized protein n=1 Tax=Clonostachys chloroleuca TaxID=1926264 RepID=A0AA35LXW0_9HYPO|nr:unnamed protein product [Clonostachys chloroleuca]
MAFPILFIFFMLSLVHRAALLPVRDYPTPGKPSISVTVTLDWLFPTKSVDISAPGTTEPYATVTTESQVTVTLCSSSRGPPSKNPDYSLPPMYTSSASWPVSSTERPSSSYEDYSTRYLTPSSSPYAWSQTPRPTASTGTTTEIFSVEPGYSLPETTTPSCSHSYTRRA